MTSTMKIDGKLYIVMTPDELREMLKGQYDKGITTANKLMEGE